jgi:DNA-binding XRE family transcriptional regulator
MAITVHLESLILTSRAARMLPSPEECRRIRRDARISQRELANAVGVTRFAIAKYEAGQRRPRGPRLVRYFEALERLSMLPLTRDPAGTRGRRTTTASGACRCDER